ncbi:MAG: hypothetical protein WC087_02830 [Candidatus Paceibacterota bacterium]
MSFSNNDLNKSRGLDTNVLKVLDYRKTIRDNKAKTLKRKQVEQEILVLRTRLNVIDREIQRLNVSERRFHGDESRAELELAEETKTLENLTKELEKHSLNVQELQKTLSSKKMYFGRSKPKISFSTQNAEKEMQSLRSELKRVNQEIEQLNAKKRRLITEMGLVETKSHEAEELQQKTDYQNKEEEIAMQKLTQEMNSEETLISRFKSRFLNQQKSVLEKKRQFEEVKNRLKGSRTVSPALENEKHRIEQKIQSLEVDLNK